MLKLCIQNLNKSIMSPIEKLKKNATLIAASAILILFGVAVISGRNLVVKSEKEFGKKEPQVEAKAKKYQMEEIDAETGQVRWKLFADQGETEDRLESVAIKNITAQLFHEGMVAFELFAPEGKADKNTREIYLFGGVLAKNPSGDFQLTSERIDISNRGTLQTTEKFNLVLRGRGNIIGKEAKINEDQSLILIGELERASLNNIILTGKDVQIERDKTGDVSSAKIAKGGSVTLKKKGNSSLTAGNIVWKKDGTINALGNVKYVSKESTLTANNLLINKGGKLTASDNVKIIYGETVCKGDKVQYENSSTVVISGGRPEAVQNGKRITANKIVYNTVSGKVEASGNVQIISTVKA